MAGAEGLAASPCVDRRNTASARITNPIPVRSRAMPTTTLKMASISAMYPVFSAVVRAVSVTQISRAPFEIGSPFSSLAACCFVVRSSLVCWVVGRLVLAHLGVGQPARGTQGVLAHDLGERERLAAGLDRLTGPLLSMLCDRRVTGRPEDDPFLLDVVAREHEPPDSEDDHRDPEQNQHATREKASDSQELPVFHHVPPSRASQDRHRHHRHEADEGPILNYPASLG